MVNDGQLYIWLMVEPTPLKNMNSSVGIMTFPIYGKNKTCSKPPTRKCTICRTNQIIFSKSQLIGPAIPFLLWVLLADFRGKLQGLPDKSGFSSGFSLRKPHFCGQKWNLYPNKFAFSLLSFPDCCCSGLSKGRASPMMPPLHVSTWSAHGWSDSRCFCSLSSGWWCQPKRLCQHSQFFQSFMRQWWSTPAFWSLLFSHKTMWSTDHQLWVTVMFLNSAFWRISKQLLSWVDSSMSSRN